MEIDDLIALKLFDKAFKNINQLEGYDFYRYKVIFYMQQFYFEEAIAHAIEMWKLADNLFQKLEYYLFRARINHQSHFRNRVQHFLEKFEKHMEILYTGESSPYLQLLIDYLELKIEINEKDNTAKNNYIVDLLKIAPEIVKYQYELLLLSFQEEKEIREKLPILIQKYDLFDQNPIYRVLKIRDRLCSLFIKIGDEKNAIFQLEEALKIIGEGRPDIRESMETKLSKLTKIKTKKGNSFLFVDADLTLYSNQGKGKIKHHSVMYERDDVAYIVTYKGKKIIYKKSEWYLSAKGGHLRDKSDWEREQQYKVKFTDIMRKNQKKFVHARLIVGNVKGMINIGKGELITLRGPKGSGKSGVINYLLGVEHPEEGEVFIDGRLLGELGDQEMKDMRDNDIALVVEGRVLIPKRINNEVQREKEIANFINTHSKEIKLAVGDLKKSMNPVTNFFYHIMAIFKFKPKIILMNEPFMNIDGILLENWLKLLSMLAKYHEIAIVLETHHVISSFYADCQYFIRDREIIEIIEREEK
ncbi:MAG: ATP-binding cassette domain-containing protein [Promethearchaeota archaeon]